MSINFQALVLEQEDRQTLAEVRELSVDDLPEREMLVRVHYSTLNYKDALAVTGKGRVIRKFPIVPGIDLAGEVVDPGGSSFNAGDQVISTGWGMGEEYWGGLGQYARLDPCWPLLLPEDLDMRSAMVMGTGGFTAALCVSAIMDHGTSPEDGPVLVTGAGGGVGGVSVMLLAKLGYEVHAVSGRESLNDYLQQIGATHILHRDQLARESKPLEKETWAAVVDTVGGDTLATVIAQTQAEGIVAACGNASGIQLNTTVFPFILRGVTLRGINSVSVPLEARKQAWELIANTIPAEFYDLLTDREITLNEVKDTCEELLAGHIRGRVVVNMQV
ncbi:MAG: MDR family oxidoreductase [Arenicellales bacterium]|jgi:acrylyl-CoA reductase (NADPH)